MKTLIVYAHPESKSLNGSLKDLAVSTLSNAGHEVRVSDLYAMNWKAVVDAADYGPEASRPLKVALDSGRAFDSGTLTPDVLGEQEKLLWADTIIFQFPLWWYTMPAILKGWVDRVFTYHFAYGVGEHSDTKYGERFGEGTLAGRRALLSVTAGGPESHYSARGINGPMRRSGTTGGERSAALSPHLPRGPSPRARGAGAPDLAAATAAGPSPRAREAGRGGRRLFISLGGGWIGVGSMFTRTAGT
ncbi:NAD(P)H-dependent oxidoreductase [Streptomyces sp. NPDC012421]|uniref:NAD(P)H-dependent oxidoreductase n=1 Tax=Streptomyces sp. NPDC012421 TaxID=3364832 RepID=UPI0036E1D457